MTGQIVTDGRSLAGHTGARQHWLRPVAEITNHPPLKFAEPGQLSSTFPASRSFPRRTHQEASTYRPPVLGAARTL